MTQEASTQPVAPDAPSGEHGAPEEGDDLGAYISDVHAAVLFLRDHMYNHHQIVAGIPPIVCKQQVRGAVMQPRRAACAGCCTMSACCPPPSFLVAAAVHSTDGPHQRGQRCG